LNAGETHLGSVVRVEAGPFVRQQILDRLSEAFRIARKDLGGGLDRLQDLVGEVGQRLEALALPGTAGAAREPAQPQSVLSCALLAAAEGEPVREFLLIPFGDVAVERPVAGESFVFTRQHAESAWQWFEQMGRKLAIDYEHQSFDRFNTRPDGLRPAAGWIGGLEVRDDGLWATEVTWTERAAQLLRSGEYRYFSPVIFWTDEDHSDVAALGPVALTNDPAMRGVRPLAATRQLECEADEGGDDDAADAAAEPEWISRAALEEVRAEVHLLRRQLAAQEADTFVERGLRLGKIVDSTSMDWRADYLRDPEAAEQRLSRAPVLLPPGRVLTLDRRGDVGPLAPDRGTGLKPVPHREATDVTAEDLAAYEQAVAAGRVLGTLA